MAFSGFNTFAALWAIVSYIGIKNLLVDIWLGMVNLLYVEIPAKSKSDASGKALGMQSGINWEGVLYHGEVDKPAPHAVEYIKK